MLSRPRQTNASRSIAAHVLGFSVIIACFLCIAKDKGYGQCVFPDPASGQPYSIDIGTFEPRFVQSSAITTASTTSNHEMLKLVALGDSVMWGNGEKREHKFVSLVGQSIADKTNRDVQVISFAHSGAKLKNVDNKTLLPVVDGRPLSDLNAERPTTEEQVMCAAVNDSDAEIVLVDGCINDVGATNIALPPLPFLNDTSPGKIDRDVFRYCSTNMLETLKSVISDFPRATIILLNYYRVVSKTSSPIGLTSRVPSERKELDRAVKTQLKAEGVRLANNGPNSLEARLQAWSDNSEAFLTHSQQCFEWAVACANGATPCTLTNAGSDEQPACPAVTKARETGPKSTPLRVFLATVPDNPDYSYGAPQKHLWSVPLSFLWWTFRADEMYRVRAHLCRHAIPGDDFCKINPTAHPDLQGAEAYRDGIVEAIERAWAGMTPSTMPPRNRADTGL